MEEFELLSEVELRGARHRVRAFRHRRSGLRVVCAHVRGPLTDVSVIVPTEPHGDDGLPHCLEHLVFLGSRARPYKGVLDTVALRCIAAGTNAWTDLTHTVYTVQTGGFEGVVQLLPVYLEHIFDPLLSDAAFVTEVFHVDGAGEQQGVVYNEMKAREQSEEDLSGLYMSRALFPGHPASFCSGGLTPSIATLSNERVRAYHREFYSVRSAVVLVSGEIDEERLLRCIADTVLPSDRPPANAWAQPPPPIAASSSAVREFPCQDELTGSVAFAWNGPPLHDLYTLTAMDVLFRYLQDTSASPIQQRFVECKHPLASGVACYLREFPQCVLHLQFSGVPVVRTGRESDTDSNFDGDDDFSDDADHSDGDGDSSSTGSSSSRSDERSGRRRARGVAARRGRPVGRANGAAASNAAADATVTAPAAAAAVAAGGEAGDGGAACCDSDDEAWTTEDEEGESELGSVPPEDEEPAAFDSDDEDHAHLLVENAMQRRLRKLLRGLVDNGFPEGPNALAEIARYHRVKFVESLEDEPHSVVSDAVITDAVFAQCTAGPMGCRADLLEILERLEREPAAFWQDLIRRYMLDAPCIELTMRPSKALAKTLAAQGRADKKKRVAALGKRGLRKRGEQLTAAMTFNSRPLPESFVFPSVPPPSSVPQFACSSSMRTLARAGVPVQCVVCPDTHFVHCRWLVHVLELPEDLRRYWPLFMSLHMESPVRTDSGELLSYQTVVNLMSRELVHMGNGLGLSGDLFATGSFQDIYLLYLESETSRVERLCWWLFAMMTRVELNVERIRSMATLLRRDIQEDRRSGSNVCSQLSQIASSTRDSPNLAISAIVQQTLLTSILSDASELEFARAQLVRLQQWLVAHPAKTLFQIAAATPEAIDETCSQLDAFWQERLLPVSSSDAATPEAHFVRGYRPLAYAPSTEAASLMLGLPAEQSGYVEMYVPCAVAKGHADFYPIVLLCELLCMSEGPLWREVRGRGVAYDVEVAYALFGSQLYFSLSDCSDICEGLRIFFDCLRSVPSAPDLLTPFTLDSAKATSLFRVHSRRSTPAGIIHQSLCSLLMGFGDLDAEREYERRLQEVTVDDVLAVYHRYFTRFLGAESRIMVTVSAPETIERVARRIKSVDGAIELRRCTFADLRQLAAARSATKEAGAEESGADR